MHNIIIYAGQREKFKTIEEAVSFVAEMRKKGETHTFLIKLTDEVYNITKPIEIDGVSDIIIEPVSKTLISGGIEISSFDNDELNGVKCVSADLSGVGNLKFTDFYVGGKAALVPRYPAKGILHPEEVENQGEEFCDCSKWFIAKKEDFDVISKFEDIEDCIISFNHFWIDEHTPIESINTERRNITFEHASRFTISPLKKEGALEYYVEYVKEMFKEKGQWYYDKKSKKLYYILRDDEDITSLKGYIPVVEKIICVKGTKDSKVCGVCLKNIDIAYTKGDYKSIGDDIGYTKRYPCYASDKQSVCNAHAGIEFEHAENCSVENCNIYCLGTYGINLYDGCKGIKISSNNISNMGAGGIKVTGGAYGSDEALHTCGNIIEDNRIMYSGNRYFSSCGILLKHTYRNKVIHNEIGYLYYTGISCGWVWGYKDSVCRDNIIEKNHIHHLGQGKLSDMGGVYTLGSQKGTVIRNNLIHDIKSRHYGGWAIYTDEGSSHIIVENNICYNASDNLYHQHYGSCNIVRNNIFAFSGRSPVAYSKKGEENGIFLEGNIFVSCGKPALCIGYNIKTPDGKLTEDDKGNIKEIASKNNIFFDIEREKATIFATDERECDIEAAQNEFIFDSGSVVINPEFEDVESFNFRLKKDSPIFSLGIKEIDISDAGCREYI